MRLRSLRRGFESCSVSRIFGKSDRFGEYSTAVGKDCSAFVWGGVRGFGWVLRLEWSEGNMGAWYILLDWWTVEVEGVFVRFTPILGEGLIGVVFGLFDRVPVEKLGYEWGNEIVICYPDCRDE